MIKNYFAGQTLTTPESARLAPIHYFLLGILIIFTCYYGLSSYALLDIHEGIYAEVAREMVVNQSYLIPHLNYVPFIEKPPLLYWLLSLSYHIFGVDEFAARFIPSTALALTALTLFYFGKNITELRSGWLSAIILLTSFGLVMIGRIVFPEMLLTFFVTASLTCFYTWYQKNITPYLIGTYAFLGLAILTDGFAPLLIIPPIVIAFMWLAKSDKKQRFMIFNKTGIFILLLITVPWFLIATVMQHGFLWDYFINEQILRLFNRRMPSDFHSGPIYYYIPRVIFYLLPWSLLLPTLFRLPQRMSMHFDTLKLFLWLWFVISLLIFSFAQPKGFAFMLVGTPPLVFLLGLKVNDYLSEDKVRSLAIVFITFAAAKALVLATLLIFFRTSSNNTNITNIFLPNNLTVPTIILLAIIILYGIGGGYLLFRKHVKPFFAFLLIVGLAVPSGFFYIFAKERLQNNYSQIAVGRYLTQSYEQQPVFLYRDYEKLSSVSFYAQQRIALIDNKSTTLDFGSKQSDSVGWFLTPDQFVQKAKSETCYVILTLQNYADFQKFAKPLNFCTIMRNGDTILLSNSPEDCKVSATQEKDKAIWDDIAKRAQPKGKVIFNLTPIQD